jgi:hypothetical protein
MHGPKLAGERQEAEAQGGRTDGGDCAPVLELVQDRRFQRQRAAPFLGKAQTVARHGAILPVEQRAQAAGLWTSG